MPAHVNDHTIEIIERSFHRGDTCVTELEVHCSCGFAEHANCRKHARGITTKHLTERHD